MLLYIIVIVVSFIVISLLNIFLSPLIAPTVYPWWGCILATLAFIALAFIMDALVAFIVRKCMPEKWFKKENFKISRNEEVFYARIKINSWKKFIPELGASTTDFSKAKLDNPYDNTYISRYILEVCYGIVVHVASVPASFLILLADWHIYSGDFTLFLGIGLPVAIINAILIYLPAMILRSNLPRLVRIYEGNEKAMERARRKALEKEANKE